MSVKVGKDWDILGGHLNIPYNQREEIRLNSSKYPTLFSKAEQIFTCFNESRLFSRRTLKDILKELGRCDLEEEMIPTVNQVHHL
jgi:hypothetical protein